MINYEEIKLTQTEYTILREVDASWYYQYITRNKDGGLEIFEDEPHRHSVFWSTSYNRDMRYQAFDCFNHLFSFIKWEDEPYGITDLLECEVVTDE